MKGSHSNRKAAKDEMAYATPSSLAQALTRCNGPRPLPASWEPRQVLPSMTTSRLAAVSSAGKALAIRCWKQRWKASGFRASSSRRMQSREGMPLAIAKCWASPSRRVDAQRWMAVGPSQPHRIAATVRTTTATRRCLRLRVCLGSESDSKEQALEPTSTNLARGEILALAAGRLPRASPRRAANGSLLEAQIADRAAGRKVSPDYLFMRAGRGCCAPTIALRVAVKRKDFWTSPYASLMNSCRASAAPVSNRASTASAYASDNSMPR